jgi:hypothetical protein
MPNQLEQSHRMSRILRLILALLTATLLLSGCAQQPYSSLESVPSATTALSEDQAKAIALSSDARPEQPVPLFLFTDPNKDPDDLSVLVLANALQDLDVLDVRYVMTTLGDQETRVRRAQFAKDVLEDLGLEQVKVGVGGGYSYAVKDSKGVVDTEATAGREQDHQVFISTPFGQPEGRITTDGLVELEDELRGVPDRSAVLLINAGMVDPAALLRDAPELLRQKTAMVVVMGGVASDLDTQGFVTADRRAYNNTVHQPSADYTYRRVQELGVPLIVVTKEAAYAAAAPRSFYDGMAATRHPVGVYLRDQQKQALQNLWNGIRQGHLPPALTFAWFFETFTDIDIGSTEGNAVLERATRHAIDFEDVWPEVSKFNLYDPLALLAAIPGADKHLFIERVPPGASSEVVIIGGESIRDPQLVRDLLSGLAIESLRP